MLFQIIHAGLLILTLKYCMSTPTLAQIQKNSKATIIAGYLYYNYWNIKMKYLSGLYNHNL